MLRSLNSGVSGLKAFQSKLDVIGNNIANVNTVGFKKSRIVFEDLLSQNIRGAVEPAVTNLTVTPSTKENGGINPIQIGLGTRVASIDTVQTAGNPTTTNLSTDLYINGNGFFKVQDSADPNPAITRNTFLTRAGNFSVDAAGHLVNPDGMTVVGLDATGTKEGPISVSNPAQYLSYLVDVSGNLKGIKADGTTDQIATIETFTVPNPSGLSKVGGSLYRVTLNSGKESVGTSPIVSGALEMSNVDLTEEMTDMITAQRGFQANGKIITTSDDILNELINLKR